VAGVTRHPAADPLSSVVLTAACTRSSTGCHAMVRPLLRHQIMLRITEVVDSGTGTTLQVEGRIVSVWVGVLQEECWRVLRKSSRRLRLDLGAVTFIDPRGVLALRWLTTEGVALVNSPAFIDALLKGDG
jgi:hypothetical protein